MTTRSDNAVLDWRNLADVPQVHECDCRYCEMGGDDEPVNWPDLVTAKRGDTAYVSDRFMMVRADRAPIPEGYEGLVISQCVDLGSGWAEPVTSRPADDLFFRRSIRVAMNLTNWHLVHLDHPSGAALNNRARVGVLDEKGDHIGWAMSSRREDR